MRSVLLGALTFLLVGCPSTDDPPGTDDSGDDTGNSGDDTGDSGDDTEDSGDSGCVATEETCNGLDDDCDGEVDEDATDALTWFPDADGDGFGDPAGAETSCVPAPGFVGDGSDCDDAAAAVWPGAVEICDGVDDDCDGAVDTNAVDAGTWYADADGDGFGDAATAVVACVVPAGHVPDPTDCDDASAATNPGAAEVCNGADDDCDGSADVGATDAGTWHSDVDGDGFGDASTSTVSCDAPPGSVADGTDCDDTSATISPSAAEVCDASDVDEDCDGAADDADASVTGQKTWRPDADGDTFGSNTAKVTACDRPPGHVLNARDCDDASAATYPGAVEIVCNGVVEDCDGADADVVVQSPGKLADGIVAATAGDVVCVYPGTYVGHTLINKKGVQVLSSGGPTVTILKGPGANRVLTVRNAAGARVSGFTITKGTVAGNGGGVLIERSDGAILDGNVISANVARESTTLPDTGYGGGVAVSNADGVIVRANTIRANTGWVGGGVAVLFDAPNALVESNVVASNTATRDGGGIVLDGTTFAEVRSNTVRYNQAAYWTGGIDVYYGSDHLLEKNVVVGNKAVEVAGGISVYGAPRVVISGGEIKQNEVLTTNAGAGGGVRVAEINGTVVKDAKITDNLADGEGGGVGVFYANGTRLQNLTLTGNDAYQGGAIGIYQSRNVSVQTTTMTGNTHGSSGGAIACWSSDASTPSSYTIDVSSQTGALGKNDAPDFACLYCTSNRACTPL